MAPVECHGQLHRHYAQFSGVTAALFDATGRQIAGRCGQVNAARNPRIMQVACASTSEMRIKQR
jgi:hypothetical protein